MDKSKHVTIYDIADALGISATTVGRAIYNKPRVSTETRRKVLEMARQMNYFPNHMALALRKGEVRMGVVLQCPVVKCLRQIRAGVQEVLSQYVEFHVQNTIVEYPEPDSPSIRDRILSDLRSFQAQRFAAVALLLSGDMTPYKHEIRALCASGVAVGLLVRDAPDSGRKVFVHSDSRCAGILAAQLLALSCASEPIAVITSGLPHDMHQSNVASFLAETCARNMTIAGVYRYQDNPETLRDIVQEALTRRPQIRGLYITSSLAADACRMIRARLDADRRINIVTADLFEDTRALVDQNVIDATVYENSVKQGKDIIRKLYDVVCARSIAQDSLITPIVLMKGNVDYYIAE